MRDRRLWTALLCTLLALVRLPAGCAEGAAGCYVGPEAVRTALEHSPRAEDLPPLAPGTWLGDVYVLRYQYGAPYDKDSGGVFNVAPRQWVAQSFFAQNPQTYDFLLVFTNFDFDSGGWQAFYTSVQNDVGGIGMPVFDYSQAFGSERLQGYLDLKRLSAYVKPDGSLDEDKLLTTLNHELGHRWLAQCPFKDAQGQTSTALLGVDGTHWSYLLDSDASYLYGSDWRDDGNGSFTAAEVMQRYSALDLYLMGMAPAGEVGPVTLLVNPAVAAAQLPRAGDTITAQASTVTLDQVVQAAGPRTPAYADSPHEFKVGLVYLVDPATTSVPQEDLDRLESVRSLWQSSFFQQTKGRGVVSAGRNDVPPGPGSSADLAGALAWLANHAQTDGSWKDAPATAARDTAASLTALEGFSQYQPQVTAGLSALASMTPRATELLALQGGALAAHQSPAAGPILAQLAAAGSVEQGWGSFPRYAGDPVSTARVIRTYGAAGQTSQLPQAWAWLQSVQVAEAGWGWRSGAPSAVCPTLEVLSAAKETLPDFAAQPGVLQALTWLASRRTDGGLGEPYPDVPQTASYLKLILGLAGFEAQEAEAVSFLARHQGSDGSWEQSTYKTALAIQALKGVSLPDPYVQQGDLSADPASPYEGEAVTVTAVVHNSGADLAAGAPYEWRLVNPSDGAVIGSLAGTLPVIVQGGSIEITRSWTPSAPAGSYTLRFVIDPAGVLDEGNRANDSAGIPFAVSAHPEGVDLRLRASAIVLDPSAISEIPQAMTLTGAVENLGSSQADSALIAVFDGAGTGGQRLATTTVSVPGNQSVPLTLQFSLTQAREHTLTIAADPDAALPDVDRTNNSAQKSVPFVSVEDVEVSSGTFNATPNSDVTVGDLLTLSATIHNRGSVPETGVQAGFYYEAGTPPVQYPIQMVTLDGTLAPGESRVAQTAWRPNQAGSPLGLSVVADPQDLISHDANRQNNTAATTLAVGASSDPNLLVSHEAITLTPPNPLQGQTCQITATVTNVGSADITVPFHLDLRLDDPITGASLLGEPLEVASLVAGGTAVVQAQWLVDGTADRAVYAIADAGNAVQEFNEEDNAAFVILDVQSLPDLVLTTGAVVVSPRVPRMGEAVRFDVTVTNAGDQSADNVPVVLKNAQGAVLVTQTIAAVPARSNASATLDWSGSLEAGEIPLTVVVNPGHAILEQSYDNNTAALALQVQSADLYVSERYISPNGDGVRDTTTLYFRQIVSPVLVVNSDGERVRALTVQAGATSVVWDGRDNAGAVVEDGAYELKAGDQNAWVVVDDNLTTISGDPSVRLLEMELATDPHDSSLIYNGSLLSPNPGDYYLGAWRLEGGTPTVVLEKCSPDGPQDLGDFSGSELLGCSMDGRTFLVSNSEGMAILTYPGPVTIQIPMPPSPPYPSFWSLSPDGRWVVVLMSDGSVVVLNAADPGQSWTFGPQSLDDPIEFPHVHFSADGSEAAIAYLAGSQSLHLYLRTLDLHATPQTSDTLPLDRQTAESGEGTLFLSSADFKRRTLTAIIRPVRFGTDLVVAFDLDSGSLLAEGAIPPPYQDENSPSLSRNGGVVGLRSYGSPILALYDWRKQALFRHEEVTRQLYYDQWTTFDKFLFGQPTSLGSGQGYFVPYLAPADNLLLDLRPHVLFGNVGVQLTLVVCDKNLDYYTLEYKRDDSTSFHPIGPPSDQPLYGEVWGTWLPPGGGRYVIRLTAYDLAGNSRSVSKSVTWNGESDIANLSTDTRFISPNSSPGAMDSVTWTYTVLRPCNVIFRILDSGGNVVKLLPKAEGTAGPSHFEWSGADQGGNPVADGEYALEYLGATWPVTVDNTPPVISLEIQQREEASNGLAGSDARNLFVHRVFASVEDAHLDQWVYQTRAYGSGDAGWLPVFSGVDELLPDPTDPVPLCVYSTDRLADSELQLQATDLAGNPALVQRSIHQEELHFTVSEPPCRSAEIPCLYPDRPAIDNVYDNGGLLDAHQVKLWPSYSTLLVQSSIWGFDPSRLNLDYRVPGAAWQEGTLFRASAERRVERSVTQALGHLLPLYWDHPGLAQQNYEVRLRYTREDGTEVLSQSALFVPEFLLGLEYLNRVDEFGGHYRITNLSTKTLTGLAVTVRTSYGGIDREEPGAWSGYLAPQGGGPGSLVDFPHSLSPGAACEVVTSCDAFSHGEPPYAGPIAAWVTARDDISRLYASTECEYYPNRAARSGLSTNLAPADCVTGPSQPAGMSDDIADPLHRFTPGSQSPFSIDLFSDPAGASFAGYDLLLDDVVVYSLTNPGPGPYTGQLDLSSKPEGAHTLKEVYRYPGQQKGLLGECPQTWTLTIDRTPPQVHISQPTEGGVICRSGGPQSVSFTASDASGFQSYSLYLNGILITRKSASGSFTFNPGAFSNGAHTLTVMGTDKAGWAGCATVHITITGDLPGLGDLTAAPKLFSPENLLGRPVLSDIRLWTIPSASFDLLVKSQAGAVVRAAVGIVPEDGVAEFAWDGRDSLGALAPDGLYDVEGRVHSTCGGTLSKVLRKAIELDDTPPALSVAPPDSPVGSTLEVRGSVTDKNFGQYQIQVRPTGCDTCWSVVASGTRPQPGGNALLGVWHTEDTAVGDYLLRVRAEDLPGNEQVSPEMPVTVRAKGLIKGFSAEPSLFSPNGDGKRDSLDIAFELLRDCSVHLSVLDSSQTVLREIYDPPPADLPTGTHQTFWDGKDGLGTVLADGTYALRLRAEDPAPSPLDPEEERLVVQLDRTAPLLALTNVLDGCIYGLPLDVNGSLSDANPGTYTLTLLSPGGASEVLAEGSGAFADQYLATLQNRADGIYQLRFEATDAAENASTPLVVSFALDSTQPTAQITSPSRGAFVKESPLLLRGTIATAHLQSYAWQYAPGADPDDDDFTELETGTAIPDGGLLEFPWDISSPSFADGPFTLRLVVWDQLNRNHEDRLVFTVDRTLPQVAITSPVESQQVTAPLDVTGTASDANVSEWVLEVIPSGGSPNVPPLASGSSSVENGDLANWLVLPPDGLYALRLTCTDRAGNAASATVNVHVGAITVEPPVNLTASVQNQVDVQLSWEPAPSSSPAGYYLYRDAQRINASVLTSTSYLDANRPQGAYTYTVRALGPGGQESADSNPSTVVITLTGPVALITSPAQGAFVAGTVEVSGTATCDVSFKEYRLSVRPAPAGAWVQLARATAPVLAGLLGTWETDSTAWPDGSYELKLEAENLTALMASSIVGVTVDNTPPAAGPILLEATVTPAGSNTVRLAWRYETAPSDLAGYYLYRDGLLANAPGPVIGPQTPYRLSGTNYEDTGVSDGIHAYRVTGADQADNESPSSEPRSVTIETRRPHAVVTSPTDGAQIQGDTAVSAECPDQDVVSLQFQFKLAADPGWTDFGTPQNQAPFTAIFTPSQEGTYQIQAVASDAGGPDPSPAPITVTSADLPPLAPDSLVARVDGGSVILTWPASLDSVGDLVGYNVYRDGGLLTESPLPHDTLTYGEAGLADGTYAYMVRALDLAGHESPDSPLAQAKVYTAYCDYVPPVTPLAAVDLQGRGGDPGKNAELQKRTASGAFETVRTIQVAGTEGLFRFDQQELTDGINVFRVVGTDADGNLSKPSNLLVLVRHAPPEPPDSLDASITGSNVTLSWTAPSDLDSEGFAVSRNGSVLNEIESNFQPLEDTHHFTASSGELDEIRLAVDEEPGTAWTTADIPSAGAPAFWQWTWQDELPLSRAFFTWLTDTQPSSFDVDVFAQGEWIWWATYALQDMYAPTMEVPLNVTAAGIRIRFSAPGFCEWGQGADCQIYLSEAQVFTLQRTAESPFLDEGLENGVYEYGVHQVNRWGQVSEEATTNAFVGVAPPASPASLAVAPTSNCGELALAWAAPEPLAGELTAYAVYRGDSPAGPFSGVATVDPAATTYLDRELVPGASYSYRVTAILNLEGVIVETAPSETVSATVACPNPPVPVITEPTTAGHPVDWPNNLVTVRGTAVSGSTVHLLQDGADVGTTIAKKSLPVSIDGYDGYALSFSGDGSSVAYTGYDPVTGDTAAILLDVASGDETRLGSPAAYDGYPALSEDGLKAVYYTERNAPGIACDLYLFDRSTGDETRLTENETGPIQPTFSPDGRWIAYLSISLSDPPALKVLSLQTAQVQTLHTALDSCLNLPVFSPTGAWIAVQACNRLLLVNRTTSEIRSVPGEGTVSFTTRPFSRDGNKIVFSRMGSGPSPSRSLWVCDIASGLSTEIPTQNSAFAAVWTAPEALAFLSEEGGDALALRERDLATGEERELLGGLSLAALSSGGTASEFCLNQTASGGLFIPQGDTLVSRLLGQGVFSFPGRVLHPGTNAFVARQVVAGSSSDSLPIAVNVSPSSFPDATVETVTAASAYPLAGDQVLVTGVVRNAGQAALGGCRVALWRRAPGGGTSRVLEQTISLSAGEAAVVRCTWDTSGLDGDYVFRLAADPYNAIPETDESNNGGQVTVYVRASACTEARTATDRGNYFPGGEVSIGNTFFTNQAPKDYTLSTLIEDEHGTLVATADTRTLAAFGPAAIQYSLQWPVPALYPGNYRVHLTALSEGEPVAESFSPFVLLPDIRITAQVLTDRTTYAAGATVNVTGHVTNAGGTLLQNLSALLKVLPAGSGPAVAVQSRPVPALPAGSTLTVTWAWPSTGAPSGGYQVSLEIRDAQGVTLATASPATFSIGASGLNLTGTLSLSPLQAEPDDALTASATTHNGGDSGLTAVTLKLSLVDPATGSPVAEYPTTGDLPAGSDFQMAHSFSLAGFQRRTYAAVLTASGTRAGQPYTRQLATAAFTVVDATPPQLVLVSPSPGLLCDRVPIRIQALDTFSGVQRAFFRLDQETQELPLVADPPPNDQNAYSATWEIPPGQEATHHLSLYAQDVAGNVSDPIEVDIDTDAAPPVLILSAPGERSCAAPPAVATFAFSDLHPAGSAATLNGAAYTSGTPILPEGNYRLILSAEDACGHTVGLVRQFRVRSAPCSGMTGNIPDGSVEGTQAMTCTRSDEAGNSIHVAWDTYNCPSTDYHLLWGYGSGVADLTPQVPAPCNIGTGGSTTWSDVPDPSTDASRFLWFLIVGDNGGATEGGWGYQDVDGVPVDRRTGTGSGQCGCTGLDVTGCGTPFVMQDTGAQRSPAP